MISIHLVFQRIPEKVLSRESRSGLVLEVPVDIYVERIGGS